MMKIEMSNKTYDVLKYIAQIFLPAFIVFMGVVLETLHVEWAGIAVTILTAFDTFLGAILKVSSDNYINKEETDSELESEE